MAKVYLSPSSQVSNPYAWGSTNEAAQCRRIADAAAAALTRSGLSVKNNQTASMEGRVAESNAWGADLHVCIHTNAFNGRVTGTRVFSWNDAGRGRAAAQAVFDELAPLTPGTSDSLSTNQTWYELRRTAAPCVYVEAEFHDNAEATRWIIEHTQQIGEAVARGICRYFGVAYAPTPEPEGGTLHRVQVGDTPCAQTPSGCLRACAPRASRASSQNNLKRTNKRRIRTDAPLALGL